MCTGDFSTAGMERGKLMKKKYVYPGVYCESFELSHHIAACDGTIVKMNQADVGSCGGTINDENDPLNGMKFFAADGWCGSDKDSGDQFVEVEGYCYTKQDNTVGFFGS